jgi:hypothetical protein
MNELVSASQDEAPLRRAKIRNGLHSVLRLALDITLPPP